jgi:hypothetical protein
MSRSGITSGGRRQLRHVHLLKLQHDARNTLVSRLVMLGYDVSVGCRSRSCCTIVVLIMVINTMRRRRFSVLNLGYQVPGTVQ